MKILVVDDSEIARTVIGRMVTAAGHEVVTASGGDEAVTLATNEDFGLILMDARMPGVDGSEATRRIRRLPGVRGLVPIIATSADAFVQDAGGDGTLQKGFSLDELTAKIATGVRSGHSRLAVAADTITVTPAAAQSFMAQIWSELPRVSVLLACSGVVWAVVTWATGGVRPQNTIDIEAIRAVQTEILRQQALMTGRLDGMWRPSDYAERDTHLSRLDSVFEALRDKVTTNDYAIKDLAKTVSGIDQASNVRLPRR